MQKHGRNRGRMGHHGADGCARQTSASAGQGSEVSETTPRRFPRARKSLLSLTNGEKPSAKRPKRTLIGRRACNPTGHASKYKASGRERPVGPGILAKERMRGTWG